MPAVAKIHREKDDRADDRHSHTSETAIRNAHLVAVFFFQGRGKNSESAYNQSVNTQKCKSNELNRKKCANVA